MNSPQSLSECLEAMRSLVLCRVAFALDHVQLDFVGEYNAFLQINKPFETQTKEQVEGLTFAPEARAAQEAATRLVSHLNSSVSSVSLSSTKFELALAGGSSIYVALASGDFEPLLFSGTHHTSPGTLAWNFVLSRDGAT